MNTNTLDAKFRKEIFDPEPGRYYPPALLKGKPFIPPEEVRNNCAYKPYWYKCEKGNSCNKCYYNSTIGLAYD